MATTAKSYPKTIVLFRDICRELKKATGANNKDDSIQHMLSIFKDNRVTDKRFCRPPDQYVYYAQTYLTYLQSSRTRDEITQKYFNKGERSIEESAKLVGLKLPKSS